MRYEIVNGLPDQLRPEAALIYWQAFRTKLGKVLGPKDKAMAFLRQDLNGLHCVIAKDSQGQLLGLLDFKPLTAALAKASPPFCAPFTDALVRLGGVGFSICCVIKTQLLPVLWWIRLPLIHRCNAKALGPLCLRGFANWRFPWGMLTSLWMSIWAIWPHKGFMRATGF